MGLRNPGKVIRWPRAGATVSCEMCDMVLRTSLGPLHEQYMPNS